MLGGGLGAHTRPRCGQGVARAMGVWLPPSPPSSLLWTPSRIGKIGTSAFVSSNSENISCVTFIKHKTTENKELALCHLDNRLVPENALGKWCKNKHGASKIMDTLETYQAPCRRGESLSEAFSTTMVASGVMCE
jgi:hypothetical protein